MATSDDLRRQFKEYANSCILSRRPADKEHFIIGASAAESYVSFVEVDKLFSYNPEHWKDIKSIFDIESSKRIKEIYTELVNDDKFNDVDCKGSSQYYRSNAIKQYYCFLKAREVILGKTDTQEADNEEHKKSTAEVKEEHKPYFSALRTKPFMLLAGISGTGKSRIVREFAFASCPVELQDKDKTTPGNYCMIEVKPNWHDSSELLGYYSNISKKYNYTKFVKFLVKAMKHKNTPFFICLDEMNLAPVEQYFAEFLSVLETRKKNGEHIVSGTLVDKKFFSEIYEMDGETKKVLNSKPSDQAWYDYFWKDRKDEENGAGTMTGEDAPEYGATYNLMEKGLTLPDNVFIIGTVNMDDTTHQFSRKVIDRAMTIEMNGGELSKMFGGSDALTYPAEDDVLDMDTFRADYVNADEVIAKHKDLEGLITTMMPEMLDKINDVLKNTPFQVSYRVLNELVIYLGVLIDDAIEKGETVDESNFSQYATTALDAIMLMKILPRIEGDSDMFYMKEEKSIEIAGEGDETEQFKSNNRLKLLWKFAPANSKEKLEEMMSRLDTTEFTRFWP